MRRNCILFYALTLAVISPVTRVTRVAAQAPGIDPVRVENVAEKLGVKLLPNSARELDFGKSVTGSLAETGRIGKFGIRTMHEGARVTITCVGPGRLRIEVDEMEPIAQKEIVQLQVAEDGNLTPAPAPKPATAKPPGVA
jgi:hypothetical protein